MDNDHKPKELENNQKQRQQRIERLRWLIDEEDETLRQFVENKRIGSLEDAQRISQSLVKKVVDSDGDFDKNLVFDFLTHCLQIIQSYKMQFWSGYYVLTVFPKLLSFKNIYIKIINILSRHLLLKQFEVLALTIDSQLPLEQKGKNITTEQIWGNSFICLILELIVFWGNRFSCNAKRQNSAFKQLLIKLEENKVVLPEKDKLTILQKLNASNDNQHSNLHQGLYSPYDSKKKSAAKKEEEKKLDYVDQLSEMANYIDQLIDLLLSEDPEDISSQISRYHRRLVTFLQWLNHIINNGRIITQQLSHTTCCLANFIYSQKQFFYEEIQRKKDYGKYKIKTIQSFEKDLKNIYQNRSKFHLKQKPPKKQKEVIIIKQLQTNTLLKLQNYPHIQLFQRTNYPWESLSRLPSYIHKYVNAIPIGQRNKGKTIGSVHIDENVVIGEGTVLQHGTMIKGPAIIGKNCQFRKGSYVRGNVIVGDNCIIGNSCELKICHFNYVGDSILAPRAHMAAGAIVSNLKLDCRNVKVRFENTVIKTGLAKFGAFIGEHAQIGCNAVLNPGSIIGQESFVYPSVSFRGYLPPNSIVKLSQAQEIVEMRK